MLKAVASMVCRDMTDAETIAKALPYRVDGYSENKTLEELGRVYSFSTGKV